MAMNELIDEARQLVEAEYGRAGAKFGLTNNSDHESCAVLLEEREEAQEQIDRLDKSLASFWKMVKGDIDDDEKLHALKYLEIEALYAACELLQVAAMAKKAAITVCDRNVPADYDGGGGDDLDRD